MRERIAKWVALFMLLFMTVPSNAGIGVQTAYADSQTYEAEASVNVLSGNASVAECTVCSGGKKVGGLYQGSSLQFNGITVSEAGSYKVSVSYISGDPRSVNIRVNGGSAENFDFPKTVDWSTVGTFDVTLQLNGGTNTIVFDDGKWYSPDIDKIVIAPTVTGLQAYNLGMALIKNRLDPMVIGRPFFINLSIAPMFPHQYAHSRRIYCDAFGTLKDTEYMLSSLTYGWWMNGTIYPFNDPEHTVLF